jgi:glutathione reductase (NADPH)
MATTQYDLVIFGTGTAASVAASRARAASWRVAVVDFRPFGGTCALRGCDPKKLLRAGADVVDHVGRMRDKGVAGTVSLDWPSLMAFKRGFTDPIPEKRERSFVENGVTTFHGKARFVGPGTIVVDGITLRPSRVLIATGAEPAKLGISGEEHLVMSETFLDIDVLPPASRWWAVATSQPSFRISPLERAARLRCCSEASGYSRDSSRSSSTG